MSDFDLPMTVGDDDDAEEPDADTLASELDLGIDLSDEERAAAEEMVAHLKEQFFDEDAPGEDEATEEEEVEDEPEEPEEPPAPVVSEAPSTRGVVVIDGVEIPVEEAVAYLTRREAQREAAQRQPEPEKPKIPEWLDQDDPAQMAMWTRQQELERQIQQIGQTQAQTLQEQTRSRAVQAANAGIATFRQLHPELSEDDITTLRTHAAAMEIIDGLARTRSGSDAVAKALDIAYWDHPEFRARATATPSPAERKKAERAEKKEKMNALGGSSGSVPRTETRPAITNDREMKEAAKAWLIEQNILPN